MVKDFSPWEQIVDERNDLCLKAFPTNKWKINGSEYYHWATQKINGSRHWESTATDIHKKREISCDVPSDQSTPQHL